MGEGGVYSSVAEAIMAYDRKVLHLQAPIKIRLVGVVPPAAVYPTLVAKGWSPGEQWLAETTLGRVLFNELLPSTTRSSTSRCRRSARPRSSTTWPSGTR